MGKYAFIDNIFGTDEEEETEANDAFDEEDDDAEASEDDSDVDGSDAADAELPEEDEASLARLDKEFRKLRARVRGLTNVSELREIRGHQTESLAGRLTPTVRLRTQDIVEEIDTRVTDLRASRGPRGS
ncbi:MAG: hypothetical protein ACOZNI_11185 [Myxococcota bacterium]